MAASQPRGPDTDSLARAPTAGAPAPVDAVPPRQADVDAGAALVGYANVCRITGTPEEMILDFGLNGQHPGESAHPVLMTHRVIVNPYTAKRLVQVLEMVVQRHEATFGVLETDVQRRVRRK